MRIRTSLKQILAAAFTTAIIMAPQSNVFAKTLEIHTGAIPLGISYNWYAENEGYPVGPAIFISGGGITDSSCIIQEPEDPGIGAEGLAFDGWYKDPRYKERFDFSQPAKDGTKLYGHYVIDPDYRVYSYRYVDENGKVIPESNMLPRTGPNKGVGKLGEEVTLPYQDFTGYTYKKGLVHVISDKNNDFDIVYQNENKKDKEKKPHKKPENEEGKEPKPGTPSNASKNEQKQNTGKGGKKDNDPVPPKKPQKPVERTDQAKDELDDGQIPDGEVYNDLPSGNEREEKYPHQDGSEKDHFRIGDVDIPETEKPEAPKPPKMIEDKTVHEDKPAEAVEEKEEADQKETSKSHRSSGGSGGGSGSGSGSVVRKNAAGNTHSEDTMKAVKGTWEYTEAGHWRFSANGHQYAAEWAYASWEDSAYWFYFDERGDMCTGWIKIGENWYYLNPEHDGKQGVWMPDMKKN